jgi:H+-translocating NAD(P) transhydrogenase subunit beta
VPPFVLELAYIVSALLFVLGLKALSSPATAPRGNAMASSAMLLAVVATLLDRGVVSYGTLAVGLIVGALVGTVLARTVKMTAMPQLVAVFNGFGGGASALVASAEVLRGGGVNPGMAEAVAAALGILVGTVTFSGSAIAFGKLQGIVSQRPLVFPLQKFVSALLFLALLAGVVLMGAGETGPDVLLAMGGIAFLLGILLVIPIGGADMPVVVSLLNSYSGLAASAAGFVLGNALLILAGALVGAAGLILTQLMCRAMNRSLANVAFGAFGGGTIAAGDEDADRTVRRTNAEEVAMLLGYASRVAFVPGYGLAVAQAQHEVRKLTDLLRARGVEVIFAIHPVAGRMPGHMNVLLAEADVPYDLLLDLDDANGGMDRTDVVVVVGANDVVNPEARKPDSLIAGMPIVDVDRAKNVVVVKRSLSPGFAGIDNPLFYLDRTLMFFADAREAMADLAREVKELD